MKPTPPHPHSIDRAALAKSLVLLGLGTYFTILILTGSLANYINLRFAPLAYVAAAIFILLALVNLHGAANPHCAHCHSHIKWNMLFIAAFPLFLAVLIPSRSLGVEAITSGISLSPVGLNRDSAFTQDPLDRSILDWLREFNRAASPAAFNGLPVKLSGFVYREPSMAPDEFMISRFTMSCCVADAYPIGMPVRSPMTADIPTGAWVSLRGTLLADAFKDKITPIILAGDITPIDEPDQPYLYP